MIDSLDFQVGAILTDRYLKAYNLQTHLGYGQREFRLWENHQRNAKLLALKTKKVGYNLMNVGRF